MSSDNKRLWPSILFLLGIISLILLAVLTSGCSSQPKGYVGVTNAESDKYLYIKKEYVVSDNASHIVISIPKADKGVWVKYSSQWD